MNKTLTSETNGHQPGHETGEEHTLTCGEEMDAEENKDSTRATLMEIMEDRSARILENQRDISAVERVLAILDASQPAGDEPAEAKDGEEATDEEEATDGDATEATDGDEATDEAEVTNEADKVEEGTESAEKERMRPARLKPTGPKPPTRTKSQRRRTSHRPR